MYKSAIQRSRSLLYLSSEITRRSLRVQSLHPAAPLHQIRNMSEITEIKKISTPLAAQRKFFESDDANSMKLIELQLSLLMCVLLSPPHTTSSFPYVLSQQK